MIWINLIITHGSMIFFGLLAFSLLVWLFYPEKGGIALIRDLKKSQERENLEDTLKFMFDCEYRNVSCGINSIAGNLSITTDKAGKLINRLETMGLIASKDDQTVELTDAGRSYALRVIRVHRIWERYLADETSIAPADWHNQACKIEHKVTVEETEKLAAQIGHPVFDPHGDPIPTADGQLPEPKGKSLTSLQEGQMARITHLEDEPRSIYEQLVVLGLYPGMQVYVADVADNKITFVADGEECVLTHFFAGYITVEEIDLEAVAEKPEVLSALKIGEKAEVIGISHNCRGQQRRRLMDFGIVPGSQVAAVMISASGDPIGFRVLGTTIGIRKQQADMVFINRIN